MKIDLKKNYELKYDITMMRYDTLTVVMIKSTQQCNVIDSLPKQFDTEARHIHNSNNVVHLQIHQMYFSINVNIIIK
jgi:hypothetical protein